MNHNKKKGMATGMALLVSLVLLVPTEFALAACSDCDERAPAAAADKPAAESRPADEPGTLRMHAPAVRFFRTNGDVRRFKATVGFDPAIYTLKRKWGPTHVAATKMGFKVYADGKLVADAGIMRPGDGTKTIAADVSGARMIALESVDGGYWLGTPQLLALWQDVRFEGKDGVVAVEEDTSGAETPRKGDRTVYDARIPLAAIGFGEKTLANGFRFNAIVYDDDGLGESRDCWIEIVPGIAGKKEYSDAPFVKVVP